MELYSKTDIGLIRKRQEDAFLIAQHPRNKNIMLLAVCDGMGGESDGDIASSFIISSIDRWFKNKSIKQINNTVLIEKQFKSYLFRLNNLLVKKYGENHMGTTITATIINKNHTIFFNCGDSRGYVYKESRLIQVTSDDSDVWYYYKYGEVEKDDLRYFVNNNLINACIGMNKELFSVSTYVINNDYDMVLLFTDGVTDMITDSKISEVIKSEENSNILNRIINEAVNVDQHLSIPNSLVKKNLAKYIVPFNGRDNATGIIYIR